MRPLPIEAEPRLPPPSAAPRPRLAEARPDAALAARARREEASYWEEVLRRTDDAAPHDPWYRYMRRVYDALVSDWLAGARGPLLKTDLFEEAVGAEAPLATLGAGGVGLDLSIGAARRARRFDDRGRPPRCLVADLRVLPIADGAVDGILSGSSLDHFRDVGELRAALAELARVLAPGASLVLTLDNPHNPVVRLRNLLPCRLLERLGVVPYFVGVTLTRRETEAELARVGLRLVETRAVAHAPRAPALALARLAVRSGRRGDRLLRLFAACERLARWPSRWRTGYYLAYRAVPAGTARAL